MSRTGPTHGAVRFVTGECSGPVVLGGPILGLNIGKVWFARNADSRLAGMAALQNDWPRARHYYLRWLSLYCIGTVGPLTILCLGWLVLWRLGAWRSSHPPIAAQTWKRLVFLAFIPSLFAAFYIVCSLVNSWLLTGNAGAYVLSNSKGYLGSLLMDLEGSILFLSAAWLVRKVGWLAKQTPAAAEEISTANGASSSRGAIGRLSRLWFLLAATLLGMLLDYILLSYQIVDAGTSLSAGLAHLHQDNLVDVYWIVDLLLIALISPIAQEVFFRGTLYAYLRREMDSGFSLVFSALLFAGTHLQTEQFFELFWAGILYAALYEVTQTLIPSTTIHCIRNLLYFIGKAI